MGHNEIKLGSTNPDRIVSRSLIQEIRRHYRLEWYGVHGIVHWARVLENGLRLAEQTGARVKVVWLFAVFHDAQRNNEGWDPDHGERGADLAVSMRGREFELADEEFRLLYVACANHTQGRDHPDITVQTCWDADRLDLGRVGIKPHPRYLCTKAGKDWETISWAYQRSLRAFRPEIVGGEWDVEQ